MALVGLLAKLCEEAFLTYWRWKMNVLNAIVRLSKDAELRFLADGTPVAQLNMALQSGYGEKAVTTWLTGNMFGKRAETLSPMLKKGQQVGIVGELTNRKYTAKDGTDKYSLEVRLTDITLLGKANVSGSEDNASGNAKTAHEGVSDEMLDDLPF
jgi:single-strand DNA-binding protein